MNSIAAMLGTVSALAIAAGCVQFVSAYDEQTDRSITALQKKTDSFFVRLEVLDHSPDCTYEKQKSFYEEVGVDVSGVKVRVDATPKNEISSAQIELLIDSFSTLEELHKKTSSKPPGKNCLSAEEIEPLRKNFNISYTAILKLELAKKRGDRT